MKTIISGVICMFLMAFLVPVRGEGCSVPPADITTDWIKMDSNCIKSVRLQIQKEIDASFTYLSMAAYFSRDTVNRPGFAELFFKSASEEREHGKKLIEYLSMRGKLTGKDQDAVTNLIKVPDTVKSEWQNGVDALSDALNLEASVTESIRSVISTCEKGDKTSSGFNDYHLVDYLTGVYLEEQYKGQRELAGKLSTLKKMMNHHGQIGEFLFDKTLLE